MDTTVTSKDVGRRDLRMIGWFNGKTRELMPGLVISPGMQVADVGCGGGQYSNFCATHGADVTFLDIQAQKVKALQSRLEGVAKGEVKGFVSDCNPVPLPDNYADLVICTEVLEHVESPDQLMSEVCRIAKPGAQLLLSVPDSRSENLVRDLVHPVYFQEPNHIRIFDREAFVALVERAGLEIERHESKGAFWAIFFLFKWATSLPEESLVEDVHPLTKAWANTWREVLDHPNGPKIVDAMNDALPKAQFVVARKHHVD